MEYSPHLSASLGRCVRLFYGNNALHRLLVMPDGNLRLLALDSGGLHR